VYAGLETRLELTWVLAAVLAVALRVASWIGVLALAWFLGLAAIVHLRRRNGLDILRPVIAIPLQERLLLRAETLAAHGFYDEAIIVARAAAEADGDDHHALQEPCSADTPIPREDGHDLRARATECIEQARKKIET
jgi:hypothetical protein